MKCSGRQNIKTMKCLFHCHKQVNETVNRFSLIGAVGNDRNSITLAYAKRKNAEKGFCVCAAVTVFYPDRRFVIIGFLDEICCGAGVEPYLILNCDCLCKDCLLNSCLTNTISLYNIDNILFVEIEHGKGITLFRDDEGNYWHLVE